MEEPEGRRRLGMGAVGQLLGVPRLTVWWWVKTGQLKPTGVDDGQEWWSEDEVYAWALGRRGDKWSGRVPVTAWRWNRHSITFDGTVELPGAVALSWDTPSGPVHLVWPLPTGWRAPHRKWVEQLAPRGNGAVVVVSSGFSSLSGPELKGLLPGLPERSYTPTWIELAEVLGQPLPWWSLTLRDKQLLLDWTPSTPTATTMAIPALDTGALLMMASTYPQTHPSARVLVNLARLAHSQSASSAEELVKMVERAELPDGVLRIAARPMPVPESDLDDIDPTQRRAGWLDLLARPDDLARRCVREVTSWDAGTDLPYSNPQTIEPHESTWAIRWTQRLVPTQRTAAFELLAQPDQDGDALVDPDTDAPVWRDSDGDYIAAMPQRLPATAPLAELILDGPVWIRTSDGKLYPAPRDSYFGLGWGYGGSGPGSLALLVDALLDDINAQAPADITGAPEGLEALLSRKLPDRTVLTRAHLEAARRGDPVIIAVDDVDQDEDEDDA
ncbi:helix-turn-helix domain-containing protein [Micromonospora sp. ALFpr18c]|uniref:helix-turn-helix domain-containing protein n=1 Tax=Micromonospora sp. ALFpr18c TaxID=1458665 RepID=UPI00124B2904|nr:helix-turn-helix domain-containing protein [Micromonospora sp. ALFpr18c]KAB1943167.1 helix-turn-helix domain-containing protein [Micromonospora sp. ALFpr18c]